MDIRGGITRRRLLSRGISAFALAPVIARGSTDSEKSQDASGNTIQGSADVQQRIALETMIDGKGPFRFLVDTGADRSVIAEDVAVRLGLISGDDVIVQGIVRSVQSTTVILRNISFGRITLDSLATPVLHRRWLGADGYLGLDVIDGRKVTFDFQKHTLSVDRSDGGASWLHPNESIVRLNGAGGRLTALKCTVDGVSAAGFIDSGAEMSIGNSRLFRELEKAGATYSSDEVIPVIGVTGGEASSRITAISEVRFGAIHFDHSFLLISDLPVFDVWGLSDQPALFLGMNFLKQTSALTIDYVRKEILFKLAELRIASRA